MSDGTTRIDCPRHGPALATFVCQHLLEENGQGFVCFDDPENPYPDAWCEGCEAVRQQAGGWDEESEKAAGISLVCRHCYEAIRREGVGKPDNAIQRS